MLTIQLLILSSTACPSLKVLHLRAVLVTHILFPPSFSISSWSTRQELILHSLLLILPRISPFTPSWSIPLAQRSGPCGSYMLELPCLGGPSSIELPLHAAPSAQAEGSWILLVGLFQFLQSTMTLWPRPWHEYHQLILLLGLTQDPHLTLPSQAQGRAAASC